MKYTASGKVLYHTAGVGIVLDPVTNTQKHFMGHNNDIFCLALHPNGKFVATGQVANGGIGVAQRGPRLCIWDADTLEEITTFVAPLTQGIKNLTFSQDGRLLAASAQDDEHMIAIYDWQAKPSKVGQAVGPIAHGKGSRAVLMSLAFNPAGDQLVSAGIREVNFHSWANGNITTKKGTGWGVGAEQGAQTILSTAFVGTTLFTGSFTGEIHSWTGPSKGKATKAHTSKVSSLYCKAGTQLLYSGGADGKVISWQVQGAGLIQKQTWDINQP